MFIPGSSLNRDILHLDESVYSWFMNYRRRGILEALGDIIMCEVIECTT